MKNKLILALVIIALVLVACGGEEINYTPPRNELGYGTVECDFTEEVYEGTVYLVGDFYVIKGNSTKTRAPTERCAATVTPTR